MATQSLKPHSILRGLVPDSELRKNVLRMNVMCVNVVSLLLKEAGEIRKALAPGQLPRDAKQVSNFKQKLSFQEHSSKLPLIFTSAAAVNLFATGIL